MQPGDSTIVDKKTAHALAMAIRYNGGRTVRKKLAEDKFQVWVIA